MRKLFDGLIVSCPNGGGLFSIFNGSVRRIDIRHTTGLDVRNDVVLHGVQPATVALTGSVEWEITDDLLFGDVHDVLLDGDHSYVVGTSGNEIIKVDLAGKEVRRWAFASESDSWHINSVAKWRGEIVFSAFGDFSVTRGYKGATRGAGFVQELGTGDRIVTDLSQPHSLTPHGQNLILANSELYELREYAAGGDLARTAAFDGYTRGLAVTPDVIYVGLSCSRNVDRPGVKTATIVALDRVTWRELDRISLPAREIYAIKEISDPDCFIQAVAGLAEGAIGGLAKALAESEARVAERANSEAQREQQIAALHDTIAECERKVEHLKEAIKARDETILDRENTISRGEEIIVGLGQAVAQRDGEVANLKRELSRQAEENAGLNQAVREGNERIAGLNQVNIEQDGQLAALKNTVAQCQKDIANLSQALAESERHSLALADENAQSLMEKDRALDVLRLQLTEVLQSRSWRATAPLRNIAISMRRTVSFGSKLKVFLRERRELLLGLGARRIRSSSLFDSDYYLAMYPDVRDAQVDPATHYVIHGWKEHRNPSAAFNTASYLAANSDVSAAGINPLIHYLVHGRREGRSLGPGKSRSKEATDASSSSAAAEVANADGADLAVSSSAGGELILDSDRIDAEVHAIRASGLFNEQYYLSMYQDLRPVPLDPIRHYCEYGWREGRNPSDEFDTEFYLRTHADIRESGLNPFWHYVFAGAAEHRNAVPDTSVRYEDDIRFSAVERDVKLLALYASPNWICLRSARPRFKGHSQPILPTDEFGYYDPLDDRILQMQTEMAKKHGIHGFCFDLNVAPDAMLDNQPIGRFLSNNEIDFRFCTTIAISPECSLEAAAELLTRIFIDRRQVRIENRPLLLVKVAENWSGACAFLAQLLELIAAADQGAPFVIGPSAEAHESGTELAQLCDAMLDLPSAPVPGETGKFDPIEKGGVATVPYSVVASNGIARIATARGSDRPLYHVVTLARDNTARVSLGPLAYTRFHIRDYRRWLDAAIESAVLIHRQDRRFVFVNAWNDWSEGLHLEPDSNLGFSRLNETSRALLNLETGLRMPKVSVIVPNYNHEPFLRRRLDSIYGQTYKNIEVILLDDASSDQSRSVLEAYATEHAEITRTFYNSRNSGSAFRQWSKGLKQATGELVWIAESDDFCDDRFLEVLVRCFDDESVLLAYGNCVFVDKDEVPVPKEFELYVSDLECAEKWKESYVETAHNEVRSALGIKNTVPNASGAVFKRPIDMPLLEDESWLSMRVAGDWVFYLHVLRGGKIAYRPDAINFFRRYQGSTAEITYRTEAFYREVGFAARTVAALYDVPSSVLDRSRRGYEWFYWKMIGRSAEEFARWYDYEAVLHAQDKRTPNILVSTLGFYPGGAEILPIRLANEFKRQGFSVLFFNAGIIPHDDRVRRMLRADIPVVMSDARGMKDIIRTFGIEALNSHQWHIQKYPVSVADVFDDLHTQVASLHGQIEHSAAFEVTEEELRMADQKVTTWVYTAEKNLGPFHKFGLYDRSAGRFAKIPNGMQPPQVVPVPRARMNIPEDAFVLCCVSRAIPDKGWAEMIDAVEAARSLSGRDIRLILVGNGPVYDEYCQVGTPDFVHLVGFSENSVGHYAAADMGIMLTKFKSESFPLTIVDCLFAGKPYIASDVGDIRNMLTVENDIAGSVIELDGWEIPVARAAQIIAAFASDKQKYLNASMLVEAAASRYRIEVVASQYAELFQAGRRCPKLGERPIGESITSSSS